MEVDFEFVHRSEIKQQAAYALSRLHTSRSYRTLLKYDVPVMAVTQLNKQASKFPSIDTADSSHAEINPAFGNDPPTLP